MKQLHTIFALLLMMMAGTAFSQQRYVDEIFTEVEKTSPIVYGQNASLILLLDNDPTNDVHPLKQPLVLDLYRPVGDVETARPLVLVFHSGIFLPYPANGQSTGTRTDSSIVEVCMRLARMGYVAASVDYRLFWNPQDPDEIDRRSTLINAAYRGIQDARTAIRFFKKTAAENGNPYGIDPNKIVLWGHGTGGYIPANAAILDDYNKILIPKFLIDLGGGNFLPMIIEQVNGDINGTSVGLVPPGYPIYQPGDTLCYPNWPNYSSEFQLAVNLGGAIADSSWIDPGQTPTISFHVPTDPFAPYVEGIVKVPVLNYNVIEVQGSYILAKLMNEYGNLPYADKTFIDPYTAVANSRNDGYEGLFPFPRADNEAGPWEWNPPNPGDPNPMPVDPADAKPYLDTVIQYFIPRACITLGLGCDLTGYTATEEVLNTVDTGLKLSPNPAGEQVQLTTDAAFPIEHVYVYDMSGRLVKAHTQVNSNNFTMDRNSLSGGTYIVKVFFEKGISVEKVIFK
ncbi:MAG: T9SS type A sorting domain-containing protein [Saprospiraceae bacterium]